MKLIIIKFLIKNFLSHNPDLLSTEIEDRMLQPHPKDIVSRHGAILKDYLAHKWDVRSAHNVNLLEAQYSGIIYTKANIKAFQDHLWKQRIKQWDVDNKYQQLISRNTITTSCPRSTEVFLLSCIHGHVPLNEFMWKLGLVSSPLCSCRKDLESPEHVILHCEEFSEDRSPEQLEITSLQNVLTTKDPQTTISFYKLLATIHKKKVIDPGKTFKELFKKLTERNKANTSP